MRRPGDAFFGKPAHRACVFVGAIRDRPPKFVEFRSCLPHRGRWPGIAGSEGVSFFR